MGGNKGVASGTGRRFIERDSVKCRKEQDRGIRDRFECKAADGAGFKGFKARALIKLMSPKT